MELMWVIGKQAIDKVDFETATDKGEHWRITISEALVNLRKPVRVPRDPFTLRLVQEGILEIYIESEPVADSWQSDENRTQDFSSQKKLDRAALNSPQKKASSVKKGEPRFEVVRIR